MKEFEAHEESTRNEIASLRSISFRYPPGTVERYLAISPIDDYLTNRVVVVKTYGRYEERDSGFPCSGHS